MIDLLTRTPHRYDLDPLTKQLRDKAVELGRKVHAENIYSSFMFCLAWLDHRGDEHLTEYACRIRATLCTCKRWGVWFEVRFPEPGSEPCMSGFYQQTTRRQRSSEPIDIGPPPTCPTCTWAYAWEQTFKTIALAYLSEPFVNLISRIERVVRAGQDHDYSVRHWTDL